MTVGVLPSAFGNITASKAGEGILQGISRDNGRTEIFIVRNDGNTPLNAELTVLVDKENVQRTDWSVDVSPATVVNLGVGEEIEVEVSLMPADDVERGASSFCST